MKDGAVVLLGGFGVVGQPQELLEGLIAQGARDLTIVSNNAGFGSPGLPKLFASGRVAKLICSFPRPTPPAFEELYRAGKIKLEIVPQGTIAERIRAAAVGVPAFFTPTSVGTRLGRRQGDARIRRAALRDGAGAACRCGADPGLARRPLGQSLLSRNGAQFQSGDGDGGQTDRGADAAYGGIGELDPESIHTPGIFVDRVCFSVPILDDAALRSATRHEETSRERQFMNAKPLEPPGDGGRVWRRISPKAGM